MLLLLLYRNITKLQNYKFNIIIMISNKNNNNNNNNNSSNKIK